MPRIPTLLQGSDVESLNNNLGEVWSADLQKTRELSSCFRPFRSRLLHRQPRDERTIGRDFRRQPILEQDCPTRPRRQAGLPVLLSADSVKENEDRRVKGNGDKNRAKTNEALFPSGHRRRSTQRQGPLLLLRLLAPPGSPL